MTTLRVGPITLFATLLLGGCAGGNFDAYEGALTAGSELAVVRAGFIGSIRKDGRSYYDRSRDGPAGTIKLRPDRYQISYALACYKSQEVSYTDTLELIAGHAYRVESACGSGFFSNDHTTYLWFEDVTTGQVIAHAKPS